MATASKPAVVGNSPVGDVAMIAPAPAVHTESVFANTEDDQKKSASKPTLSPGGANHIYPLTGARIFAALWVVAFHFRFIFEDLVPGFKRIGPLARRGSYAVPFFFILSGFILSHNYFEKYSL